MKSIALPLAALLLMPLAASAQGIQAFWDSITAAPTLQAAMSVARPEAETRGESEIVEGIVNLRAYELTFDATYAFRATHALTSATEFAPQDAWSHFALGAMLARGPDVRERVLAERNAYRVKRGSGTNASYRAPRELRAALKLDPTFDLAAIELGTLALDLNDRALMQEAMELLTAPSRAKNGEGLIVASRIANRLKTPLEGAQHAQRAKDEGLDPSVAEYQTALSFFRLNRLASAAEAYFAGLEVLSDAGSQLYFNDLALLLSEDQARTLLALPLSQRKDWIHHYWDRSAALAGVSIERRLAEHYRRLDHNENGWNAVFASGLVADTVKHTPSPWRLLTGGAPHMRDINPQAISLIRYGDPAYYMKYVYCQPGWDRLPVPMQPSLRDCMQSAYGRGRAGGGLKALIEHAKTIGLPGEAYYPNYKRNLMIVWEALQFRSLSGGAQVVATVATRGASAAALKNRDGDLEPRLTLTLADTAADWIRRAESNNAYATNGLTADAWALFGISARAPAGDSVAVSVAVENADASSGVIAHGRMQISSFDPDSLTMSDIVMSPADGFGSFERGNVRVVLAPGRSYTTREVPTLYYEVYGIKPGSAVTTEIRIVPLRTSVLDRMRAKLGRGDGAVASTFDETAKDSDSPFGMQQKRNVGLDMLEPGQYTLTVIVTDRATGRTVQRDRQLQIDR